MKIGTKYFGEVEYVPDEALQFPKGLFGFEEEKQFLLMPFSPNEAGEDSGNAQPWLFSLQSVTTPELAFVMVDPFVFDNTYAPILSPEELKKLSVTDSTELMYYVMCIVRQPVAESTVNFRCPVAINAETLEAMQVILEDNSYEMRHRLGDFTDSQEEGQPC